MTEDIIYMRHSQANHPRIQKFREDSPVQVEVTDWVDRIMKRFLVKKTNLPALHEHFNVVASWCDHVGMRTFGFKTQEEADKFIAEYVNRPQ